MDHRTIKDELFHEFSRIGKAISSPKRLEMLDLLAQAERTVEAIAAQTDLSVKNASAHLRVLRSARLVATRKESTYVFYRLADAAVMGLVQSVEAVARARLAEVQRLVEDYYADPGDLEPVSADELRRRLAENDVVLLDVRPAEEYRAGHIPGAWSMPIDELKARLAELPRDREVIAYCRGPYCLFSLEALTELRRDGRRARRMEAGVLEWKAAGRPVAVLAEDVTMSRRER